MVLANKINGIQKVNAFAIKSWWFRLPKLMILTTFFVLAIQTVSFIY